MKEKKLHVTHDKWRGGEPALKVSALQLLRFGSKDVWKLFSQRITESFTKIIKELFNDKGVCRTAPATPGLLKL